MNIEEKYMQKFVKFNPGNLLRHDEYNFPKKIRI